MEREAGYKWRRMLCRMWYMPPYIIRCRLIGERQYQKTTPWEFADVAEKALLH